MGMLGLHLENPSDERSVIIGLGASAASPRRWLSEQNGASLHHVAEIEKLLKWLQYFNDARNRREIRDQALLRFCFYRTP